MFTNFSCDSDLQTQWSGCPRYKARCIARRAGLYSIIDTPSKVSLAKDLNVKTNFDHQLEISVF